MKRTIYNIVFLVTVFITGISCSKDYLETSPTDAVKDEFAVATTASAFSSLNGMHRSMYMQYSSQDQCGEGSLMIFRDMLGEDLVMTAAGNGWWNAAYQWLTHRNVNATQLYFDYRFYYKIIGNANVIIANIDNATGPDSDKKMIKAQALTYRAWAHFNLVQLFGKRYDANNKPNTQLGVPLMIEISTEGLPRATVEDVYTQINLDLDDAITNFEAGAVNRKNKSHLNVSVAKGLKARVALTMQDWETAARYAAEARSSYTLMSNAEYVSGFNNYTNPEWMWGSHVIEDQTTYFYSFFAYMSVNFSSTNIRGNPKAINSKLYRLIPLTDVRKQLWDSTGKAFTFLPSAFAKKAYMNKKFQAAGESDSRGDVPYMRVAEMFLIESEAKARLGDPTATDVLYTLVKNRYAGYVKSTKTGQDLIDEILIQRRIELWGEGFRFLDLKRLNLPLDRTGSNHSATLTNNLLTVPADDIRWQFLFPQAEINANPAMKDQQNPL